MPLLLLLVLACSQCLAASTISVKPAMPPPLASATSAAADSAASSGGQNKNPVVALAGFLKDQLVRMKDGALALKQGEATRRLVPELTVPADTRRISFGKNGQLTVNDRTINGQHLRLYRVTNLQHLESSNGILFQITESQAKTLEEVSDFRVHSNSLEASNVDRESAMATVRQLELIKELSGDIP